jgi:hypothetical protein
MARASIMYPAKTHGSGSSWVAFGNFKMTESSILLVILVAVCFAAAIVVGATRARKKGRSGRREALRQNHRLKVMNDEVKINRLIDFERAELKRKGQRETTVEGLMERAVERWERDNAGAAPLY